MRSHKECMGAGDGTAKGVGYGAGDAVGMGLDIGSIPRVGDGIEMENEMPYSQSHAQAHP